NVANAIRAIDASDLGAALPHLVNALDLDERNADREAVHRFMFGNALARCPKLSHLWLDKGGGGNAVEFSPDGNQVLVAQSVARIVDLDGTQKGLGFAQGTNVFKAAYSRDGGLVVSANGRDAVVWRVSNTTSLRALPHPALVLCAAFNSNATHVITG